MTVYWLLQKMQ